MLKNKFKPFYLVKMDKNREITTLLTANQKALDVVSRKLSFGAKSGTHNLIDERDKAVKLAFKVANASANDVFIALYPMVDSTTAMRALNPSIYASKSAFASAIGGTPLIDGTVVTDVTCTSLDSAIAIETVLRYMAKNPTRITGIKMKSKLISGGAKDSSNYDNKLKTIWMNPLDVNEVRDLPLGPLQIGMSNFNPDMLEVDFLKQGFPVIISDEHAFLFQVNAGTELTMTLAIGAQDSKAQRFWRDIKKADEVLRSVMY